MGPGDEMMTQKARKAGLLLAGLGVLLFLGGIFGAATGDVAEASHNTYPVGNLSAQTQVTICHTEGNASQHQITVSAEALITAGHFDAEGNPIHAVGSVHDFIVSIEGVGVINPVVGS